MEEFTNIVFEIDNRREVASSIQISNRYYYLEIMLRYHVSSSEAIRAVMTKWDEVTSRRYKVERFVCLHIESKLLAMHLISADHHMLQTEQCNCKWRTEAAQR